MVWEINFDFDAIRLGMKKTFLVLMMAGLLVACQSMPTQTTVSTGSATTKEHLAQAIQASLKSSFGYSTHVKLSNQHNLSTTNSSSAYAIYDCDGRHDEAYVALARRAVSEGFDITSDRYIDDRQALKEQFLACIKRRENPAADMLATEVADTDNTKLALMDAYWLKPSQFGITGNYQPMQGVITALPSFDYQMGQVSLMANQPIYIDIRTGDIYLWADNFALANATWLDKSLGDKWHNKWLRLSLDDGSLPDGFHQAMIKAYLSAYRTGFDELEVGQFDEATADDVPQNELITQDHIAAASRIIRHHTDASVQRNNQRRVLELFYQKMLMDYPMLDRANDRESGTDDVSLHNITVPNDNDATADTKVNAKKLMQALFAYIHQKISTDNEFAVETQLDYTDMFAIEGVKMGGGADANHKANKKTATRQSAAAVADAVAAGAMKDRLSGSNNSRVVAATLEDKKTEQGFRSVYYGLDYAGRLLWIYRIDERMLRNQKPIMITSLTTLHSPSNTHFARLPSNYARPNQHNSVDLWAYGNELLDNSDSHGLMLQVFLAMLNPTETQSVDMDNSVDAQKLPTDDKLISDNKPISDDKLSQE